MLVPGEVIAIVLALFVVSVIANAVFVGLYVADQQERTHRRTAEFEQDFQRKQQEIRDRREKRYADRND